MGGKKLSTERIEFLVKEKGGTLLGEETKNHRRVLNIKCKNGHEWKVLLNNFKRGDWCKKCFNDINIVNRRHILELIKDKNYILLTEGEIKKEDKITLYCPKHDHKWKTCYFNLKYNKAKNSCRLCARKFLGINEIKDFINNKNGTLIKKINGTAKSRLNLLIKCNVHGCVFKTRWGALKRGVWCSKCDDEKRTIKYEQIKELVESKNGTILSDCCKGATKRFKVRCNVPNCNRVWETSYSRIKSGCWCPKCAGFDKYTLDEVKQLIGSRGKLLTTTIIKNAHQRIEIRCKCGNVFNIPVSYIVRGRWCSVCRTPHTAQLELFNIIKTIFFDSKVMYNDYPFQWLRDKNKLEIDIWIPEIKLAIEYDGKQHFIPTKFSNTMTNEQVLKSFELIKRHDNLKNKLISQHPDEIKYFIRFNYKESITKDFVFDKLRKAGVNEI